MKKIEIIPAIDIIDGKCVRLSQGDYDQKTVYDESPLEMAKKFEAAGIKRLHLVDLDGAKAQHIVNHKIRTNFSVIQIILGSPDFFGIIPPIPGC
jgi:phosphoribosylformimino-5-aminoimidazole carboxamide ribotide isomerase